ncbi:MAG: hypothetical protein BWK80_00245 [Desulfobacteraceae bacterium IS3]|nr:MAG: hypothetical protein BWK80_00245 [Desulfobacteraceae bacterium IS3]
MDSVAAIVGVMKSVLGKLHQLCLENRLDDTEYIRNVKAVLEAAAAFLDGNKGISENPENLKNELYLFARNLWLNSLNNIHDDAPESWYENSGSEDNEYREYYYDYIYKHGVYPR